MPNTNGHGSHNAGRIALCLRVSSEEQRDRETIEIQRDFLAQYCELYGLEVADVYADDGVSGTIPLHERPEGRRLLEDAKEGKFQTLLVYRLDRLGRSLLVIVDAHDRLQSAGVSLRSATEPIDTSTPSGRLIFQMLASFAEYERAAIGERTRAGLHRAYRGGRHMGVVPYGYCVDEHGHLQIVPEEAEIFREITANIADGSTLYREAKRLDGLGIPPPGCRYRSAKRPPGKQWSASTLRNLITRNTYSGTHEVRINGGEGVIEQPVPVIVERNLQERARASLAENKRLSGGPAKRRKYLLTGLVICDACGCSCNGLANTARGKKYLYYKCNDDHPLRAHRAPTGHAPYVNARWLEELVWADVKRFLENPGEVLGRVREQLAAADGSEKLEARRTDLAKRLAAKQAEKDRYVRAYAQGHISEDELAVYTADLKNQVENLKLLITSVESDLAQWEEHRMTAESTEAWLTTLRERMAEVDENTPEAFGMRRRLVKLLVERITAGRDEHGVTQVRITYRFGPPGDGSSDSDDSSGGGYAFVSGINDPSGCSAG